MTGRRGLAILALVTLASLLPWFAFNQARSLPDASGRLAGIAFNPFQSGQDPASGDQPSAAEIARDLALVGELTGQVRSYSVEGSLGLIPALAERQGLSVMLGAWLGSDREANDGEVARAIALAQAHPAVERLLIGNEALLRAELSPGELVAQLRRVRAATDLPVSTAEPWHIWLEQPALAREVDFLAVHILPYWEGIPLAQSLDYVAQRLAELRAAFPDKPIVLTEVGWPSDGPSIGGAVASRLNQAEFLRRFALAAADWQLDYMVVEAFDQPWKFAIEGETGAYWGLFDAARQPKFAWQGPLSERPAWPFWAALSSLLALLPCLVYFRLRRRLGWPGQTLFAVLLFGLAAALVWSLRLPFETYLGPFGPAVWWALFSAELLLFASVVTDAVEMTGALWGRAHVGPAPAAQGPLPKVSIHVPCRNEPAEMLERTLEALARLDYPDFEVLVIDNNTASHETWSAIAKVCARLGERFRFFHLEDCPGYKAGALNFARARTAADAELIAVLDSDYLVAPGWLRDLAPAFAVPDLALVQAPQDYRDGDAHPFKAMCFWEYASFFRVGMIERDRRNAIIQHGTMTLVRKAALDQVGGWSEWCVTEDAELGLRLLAAGWRSSYVPRSYGRGLVPDSLAAYRGQRFRWAYGAVQILRHHWRRLFLPGGSELSWGQRYHFVAGWLPWLTDALGLICTLAAIGWSFALAAWPDSTIFPEPAFLVPVLGIFLFKHLRSGLLYGRALGCSPGSFLQATLAAQALSYGLAKAVLTGLVRRELPFYRTPKCRPRPGRMTSLIMVHEELTILMLLAAAFAAVGLQRGFERADALLWLGVLAVQAAPYLAAIVVSAVSSRPSGREAERSAARKRLVREAA